MGDAAKARHEAIAVRELAKAAKDVAAAAADDTQDISLQVGFKTLCQALLQMAFDFDVEALDVLVTMDVINTAVLEAKAEIKPGQMSTKGTSPTAQVSGIEGTSSVAVEETEVAWAHSHIAEAAFIKGSTNIAPTGENVKVVSAGNEA